MLRVRTKIFLYRLLERLGVIRIIQKIIAREIESTLQTALQAQAGLSRLHSPHGVLKSTAETDPAEKFDANQFYQYSDKALCALAAASMWRGGDYMEFGSTDLNTFRNMLTAYDIFRIDAAYPDTRFYGFDVFGRTETKNKLVEDQIDKAKGYRRYMDMFSERGDVFADNCATLKSHGLFFERCHLVQGYFEETLSPEFKSNYCAQGRQVGFACLDCNISPPYKIVFEFLIDLMAPHSYIYMDEYYSNAVITYFDQFVAELKRRRGMDARFMRNAGGFGALFFLYPTQANIPPLEF